VVVDSSAYPSSSLDKQNQGDMVTGGAPTIEPQDGAATGGGEIDDFQARLDALNKL
jgi:hypothetical protein